MTSRTDARNVIATYGYNDPLSRLKSVMYQAAGYTGADDVTNNYDNESNVTGIASQNGGTFGYGYDELNRMTSQTWTIGGQTYTTSYHYNSAGCLDSMTYPTGTTLTMTCDTENRVTGVSLPSGTIVSNVAYHPSGQVKAMTYGNARATTIVYDDRARANSVTSTGVLGLSYGYDGADNVTSFNNSVVANSNRTMMYDKRDRIITSTAFGATTVYDYDDVGNRNLKSGAVTTNYTYDSNNRLASASGPEHYNSITLTWDVPGRLASTSDGGNYLYEGRGRRVQKTDASGTTLYHYDASGRVISETLPDGTKLRDYIYLGNKLIAVDGCITTTPPGCSEREWYHTDTLGTPLARTNAAGNLSQFDYQAWGEPWSATGLAGDRQYNGRVFDPGTGFHDYGARMYWPQIGRFISPDTAGPDVANPASFNRYSYVQNNPYKYVDPTGRDPVESRILENPISYSNLERAGLADKVSTEYIVNHGLEREAAASVGASLQGMTQSERNLLAVVGGGVEAYLLLAGTALTTVEPNAGTGTRTGGAGAVEQGWKLGGFKSAAKWESQMAKRGWTPEQITEAMQKGEKFAAENLVNKGNAATRYVHPETGRSVVVDDVTKEVLHVGGEGFNPPYSPSARSLVARA